MSVSCLIVEDEKLAQDVLKKYITLIPSLQLTGCCSSASEAISFLHTNAVDLIFLDINMPELNGIDFLKTLNNPPQIIITTAYSEYAMDGYEYSVCDYLLKPISYERFLKSINKAVQLLQKTDSNQPEKVVQEERTHFFVKEDGMDKKIDFDEILYIQAFGNYLKIFTKTTKTIITRLTLTEIEAQLPTALFLRIHKSYIVALKSIDKIQDNQVYISSTALPLGTTYKQEVLKRIRI